MDKILFKTKKEYEDFVKKNIQHPTSFLDDVGNPEEYPCIFVYRFDYLGDIQLICSKFIYESDFKV